MIKVSIIFHKVIQLDGWCWHKLLCMPVDSGNYISVYQTTDLAIHKLKPFPYIIEFISSTRIIANAKIGQTPAKFDNVIGNIFKAFCGMNVHKGSKILLEIYNPTQLQTIRGRPFMVSPCVIPCCKIIPIQNYIHAKDDNFAGFKILLETVIKKLLIICS